MSFHSAKATEAWSSVNSIDTEATDLDNQWSQVESATGPAKQKIINVQSLLDYRSLWPKLVSDIQAALPQSTKPQFGVLNPDDIKKTPRKERQIIWIDSMVSDYRPDITELLKADDIRVYASTPNGTPPQIPTAQPPAEGAPPPTGEGLPRGFILTIRVTTPYATGGQLIENQFIKALLNIKPNAADKDKKYQIVKAQIIAPLHVGEDATRVNKMRSDYAAALQAMQNQNNVQVNFNGGGNYGGGGGGGDMIDGGGPRSVMPMPNNPGNNVTTAQPGQPDDAMAFQDRATGESVLADWEATVVALVQLDPPPPGAPVGQQANAQQP
jgi:hypothetical protein